MPAPGGAMALAEKVGAKILPKDDELPVALGRAFESR